MKNLSFNKSRAILQSAYSWYQKRKGRLSPEERNSLEEQMLALEGAIAGGNQEQASTQAEILETFSREHCKKSLFDYVKEVVIAILIALVLAVVVRQVWFELYEIPTGSMRPTFREQDRVAVTKTPFGINIPMTTGHLLFDPNLVKRGGAITFTSEGIDRLDEDTIFMWVIPYKKRLIKRLIGKPGDSLYFYGGKIYGVDKDGNSINELLNAPWMDKNKKFSLEHIPMMRFSGEYAPVTSREVRFTQMGIPLARLLVEGSDLKGEINSGGKWIPDDPSAQRSEHTTPKAYSDFFGMRNFAMARLLTAKELKEIDHIDPKDLPEGVLYLELSHHPSTVYPHPAVGQSSRHPISLSTLKSVIPLKQEHLDIIMKNMYTARLVFKNGRATRYNVEGTHIDSNSPLFPGVPDGTYEFYNGNLENIGWGGRTIDSDKSNPLYKHDPKNVQQLYNLGIEMYQAFAPRAQNQLNSPSRYAYFRDGDLYVLGAPLFKKEDPLLKEFTSREEKREKMSSKDKPYSAFKDYGPPLKGDKLDVDFIRAFGVTVPSQKYLMLGDNHAMSSDSRAFGFVPEANLQGAPSLILWPTGERMGAPWQAPYKLLELPRLIVWSIVALSGLIWYWLRRRYLHRPIVLNRVKASASS
ncbi:MAG: signal peptidase I [Parachlamydiaceae bacterium]|nr:signal peptidase I [Parachlamydiaceae bacterium]